MTRLSHRKLLLCVCVSIFVCLSVRPSVYLSLSVCLSVCLSRSLWHDIQIAKPSFSSPSLVLVSLLLFCGLLAFSAVLLSFLSLSSPPPPPPPPTPSSSCSSLMFCLFLCGLYTFKAAVLFYATLKLIKRAIIERLISIIK